MTPNSELVLNYLKKNYGKEFSKQEIADALNISVPAVTGSLNGLIKNEYAITTRTEEVTVTPATEVNRSSPIIEAKSLLSKGDKAGALAVLRKAAES